MRLAVYGRTLPKKVHKELTEFFDYLIQQNIELYIFHSYHDLLIQKKVLNSPCKKFETKEDLNQIDFFVSIGGDGTLLETIQYIKQKETPVIGINAGRLGFLANITIDKTINVIDAILNNEYELDKRILLSLETDKEIFEENYAINEFAISKRDNASMIVIHTYLDGEFLNSYWADGLIIATPTGSTAYSLSCGGPLVMPKTNNFIISPINPHNLNVRPMIVSDESELILEAECRNKKMLISLDSRSKSIEAKTKIKIKKADFQVNLVTLKNHSYFNTLRNKLNWGLDSRN